MTQEQKDLLLKDLCARLPYGVKVEYENETFDVEYVSPMYEEVKLDIPETWTIGVSEVKPYLLPLSSMTEEQKEEFNTQSLKLQLQVIDEEIMYEKATEFEVDFYNKHHLDWRGLIPMGLAIDATDKNIY
jgi:hypothetical protein